MSAAQRAAVIYRLCNRNTTWPRFIQVFEERLHRAAGFCEQATPWLFTAELDGYKLGLERMLTIPGSFYEPEFLS
ncbi:MAG: hypothetical protein ABIA63_09150 [bacterium]